MHNGDCELHFYETSEANDTRHSMVVEVKNLTDTNFLVQVNVHRHDNEPINFEEVVGRCGCSSEVRGGSHNGCVSVCAACIEGACPWHVHRHCWQGPCH